MKSRSVLMTVVLALGLACAVTLPTAHADPPKPGATKKPKGATPNPPKPGPAPATSGAASPASSGGAAPATSGAAPPSSPREIVQRESRIEFDERMVRGQSAAGAIFLFQRAPSDFKSIVDVPDSFRAKTVELVQPRGSKP
jgi:hypothetical protein